MTAPERIFVDLDNSKGPMTAYLHVGSWPGVRVEYVPKSKTDAEIATLRAEIQRCHERLEITHVFQAKNETSGIERVEVPYLERVTMPDGIQCRDATIELLEQNVAALRAKLAAAREVKELEWGDEDRNGGFYVNFPIANRFEGFYQISQLEYDLAEIEVGVVCHEFGSTVVWRGPKGEAKEAANAHNKRRILAALKEV